MKKGKHGSGRINLKKCLCVLLSSKLSFSLIVMPSQPLYADEIFPHEQNLQTAVRVIPVIGQQGQSAQGVPSAVPIAINFLHGDSPLSPPTFSNVIMRPMVSPQPVPHPPVDPNPGNPNMPPPVVGPDPTPTPPGDPADELRVDFRNLEKGARCQKLACELQGSYDYLAFNQYDTDRLYYLIVVGEQRSDFPHPTPMKIEEGKETVFIVWDSIRSTGGYSIQITNIEYDPEKGEIVVKVRHTIPSPDAGTTQALTRPYHFVAAKIDPKIVKELQAKGKVRFEHTTVVGEIKPPPHPTPNPGPHPIPPPLPEPDLPDPSPIPSPEPDPQPVPPPSIDPPHIDPIRPPHPTPMPVPNPEPIPGTDPGYVIDDPVFGDPISRPLPVPHPPVIRPTPRPQRPRVPPSRGIIYPWTFYEELMYRQVFNLTDNWWYQHFVNKRRKSL